jgi:hypothetical protein
MEETTTKKKHLIWIIIGAAVIIAIILFITLGLPGHSSGPTLSDNVTILQGQVVTLQSQMTTAQGNLVNIGVKQSEIASNFSNIFALVSAIPNWSPTIQTIQNAIADMQAILANYVSIHTKVLNETNLRATIYGTGNFSAVITAYGNWTDPSVSLSPGSANCTISGHYLSDNLVTVFVAPLDIWENGGIINVMIQDSTGSINYASSSIGGSL